MQVVLNIADRTNSSTWCLQAITSPSISQSKYMPQISSSVFELVMQRLQYISTSAYSEERGIQVVQGHISSEPLFTLQLYSNSDSTIFSGRQFDCLAPNSDGD